MSWFNGKIMSEEDVRQDSLEIPAKHQLGGAVYLYLGNGVRLPAKVVGVKISGGHAITYDLAFKISGTNYFSVIEGVRGFVYGHDELPDEDGGLVEVSKVQEMLKDEKILEKPRFMLVKGDKEDGK